MIDYENPADSHHLVRAATWQNQQSNFVPSEESLGP